MREQNEGTNKILTVAICAYNMEKYIERALKSCIIEKMNKLEVLIMNDGSTDNTAKIAQKYCEKYPGSFILINKENGGWGSNINQAVQIANGKYFKILDADDWFDTQEFEKFVDKLEHIDVDMVFSPHREGQEGAWNENNVLWNEYLGRFVECKNIKIMGRIMIWDIAFDTELLKRYHEELPIHTLYTDTLYIMNMLFHISNMYFYDGIIYNYFIGREEQSVDINSKKRHYKDFLTVVDTAIERYQSKTKKNAPTKLAFDSLCAIYSGNIINDFIRIADDKKINSREIIKRYEKRIKEEMPDVYKSVGKRKLVKFIRLTDYHFLGILQKYMFHLEKWKV